MSTLKYTVENVYDKIGYNEQPDITSRFGAKVRSRRCTYMIIATSVITRTGYNEQIRLDLGARYIRFLLYSVSIDYHLLPFSGRCCFDLNALFLNFFFFLPFFFLGKVRNLVTRLQV